MKGYSELNIFTPNEIHLFCRATFLVEGVKDAMEIRCHELARAVGRVLDLEVQDGSYGFVDHAWLWTTPLKRKLGGDRIGFPNILDVYSPGHLPMVRLLLGRETALPHVGWSYRPAWEPRTDIDWDLVDSLEKEMLVVEGSRVGPKERWPKILGLKTPEDGHGKG